MTTTCNSFIHEYSMFDDMYDCLNESVRNVEVAMGRYKMKMHQIESKLLFEAADAEKAEETKQTESKGVLAKIGESVMKLLNKITGFIKKFTDKLTGNIQLSKSDEEKVSRIISQHPELKDQIVQGINKEWFTVSDVAGFEKDVVGLINMLEKNAIDHQTFMDRFRSRCQAFTDSAKPIADAAMTVVTFMKIIPEVHKAAKGTKEAISGFKGMLEKFKNDVDHNYGEKEVSKAHAIMNALAQAIGLTTKDAQKSDKEMGAIRSFFHNILKSDKTEKHQKAAKERIYDKKQKEAERIQKEKDDANNRRNTVADRNINLTADTLNNTPGLGQRKTRHTTAKADKKQQDEQDAKNNP